MRSEVELEVFRMLPGRIQCGCELLIVLKSRMAKAGCDSICQDSTAAMKVFVSVRLKSGSRPTRRVRLDGLSRKGKSFA